MGTDRFTQRAVEARRGQWRLPDLPWDEPVKLAGASRRERMLCKFDLLDACDAIYHLKLGARKRMGEMFMRAWNDEEPLLESLEWLDTDELRHLRALRRLEGALRTAGREEPDNEHRTDPTRMWRVARCPRNRPTSVETLALRMLVDESAGQCLLLAMSRQTRVPLARAVFAACAEDDGRHADLMSGLVLRATEQSSPVRVVAMQSILIAHVARLQSALRPYFRSFAGVTGGTTESIATDVFHAISHSVGKLGTAWTRYPTARVVHAADRSPWMLWLLR